MAWKIRIHQIPVAPGGPQHNFVVVEDGRGDPYAEFNGGPIDKNGQFIELDPRDFASINSRVSSGILGADVRYFPFERPLNLKKPSARLLQEIPMTQQEAVAAVKAADACRNEMNALQLPYRMLGTGPEIDHMSESNAPLGPRGFNSNGVFSTLLACMGVTPTHPAIKQPGGGQLVLSPSRIDEIRQQFQPASPGDGIPLPRPRPQIRGDIPGGEPYQETGVTPEYAQEG